MRGLLREILSLLSWIVSFFVANAYSDSLAVMLPNSIPGTTLRVIVAFIALFIGVRLLMSLFTMAVDALVKASGLKLVDRGLGGLFGLGRGIVIVLAVVLLCSKTSIPEQDFWKKAMLVPVVEALAYTIKPFLPGDFARHIQFTFFH